MTAASKQMAEKYDQAMKDWSADAIKKTEAIVKLEAKNKRLKEALLIISKGCPTGAKGCLCLENTAIIALWMPADQLSLEQKALSSGGQ